MVKTGKRGRNRFCSGMPVGRKDDTSIAKKQ